MNNKNLKDTYDDILKAIIEENMTDVFDGIGRMIESVNDSNSALTLNAMQRSYDAFIDHVFDGNPQDKKKTELWNKFLIDAYNLASTIRNEARTDSFLKAQKEERNEFNSIFTSRIWNEKEREHNMMRLLDLDPDQAAQAIAGTTFSLFCTMDAEKIFYLLDIYENATDDELATRALVGTILAISVHEKILHIFPQVTDKLERMSADKQFCDDACSIVLQFLRCKETQEVTRKMNHDILPKLMKNCKELEELTGLGIHKSDSILLTDNMNPKWEKSLDAIDKQFNWLNKKQREGSDIFHASFSMAKNFAFFSHIGNWVRPFSPFVPDVSSVCIDENGKPTPFARALQSGTIFCSSDCYSMCFLMKNLPEAMQATAKQQMKEFESVSTGALLTRGLRIKHYMEDLYRFFTISPMHSDFPKLFIEDQDDSITTITETTINIMLKCPEKLSNIAKYLMEKRDFQNAGCIYGKQNPTKPEDIERQALCNEKQYLFEEAIDLYNKAYALGSDNIWLHIRAAQCYGCLKRYDDAIVCIKRFCDWENSPQLLLELATFYQLKKDFDTANKILYKADWITEQDSKIKRKLAESLLRANKADAAIKELEKLTEREDAIDDDVKNLGHAYLIKGEFTKALDTYMKSETPENVFGNSPMQYSNFLSETVGNKLILLMIESIKRRTRNKS